MIKGLEDVQSPDRDDLPANITLDVTVMDGVIALIVKCNSSLRKKFVNFRNYLLAVCQSSDWE